MITDEASEVDLSDSTVTVVVENHATEVRSLSVDLTDSATGVLCLTLDQETFDKLGNYSIWRLRESPYFQGELALLGRIVEDGTDDGPDHRQGGQQDGRSRGHQRWPHAWSGTVAAVDGSNAITTRSGEARRFCAPQ